MQFSKFYNRLHHIRGGKQKWWWWWWGDELRKLSNSQQFVKTKDGGFHG